MNDVLASHKLQGKQFTDCVLNVYLYRHALVGVVEHKRYRRICDMNSFNLTAQDYIAWRHQQQAQPAPLIDRNGRAINSPALRHMLHLTAEDTGWPVFSTPVQAIFLD